MEKLKTQLTLFWLIFPVYKVDDISVLKHVRLLFDQFCHVDHRAICATEKQTYSLVCFCTIFFLSNPFKLFVNLIPARHYSVQQFKTDIHVICIDLYY